MRSFRTVGRRFPAAALTLAAALALAACGGRTVPAEEYDPDAPVAQDTATPAPAAEAAPPPAPGAPPAAPLTPEQDSIQEARAFARRQQSMESYQSCIEKTNDVEEPARTTLRAACARTRGPGAKP